MAFSLSSAVIPFAALATFGGVYVLTPSDGGGGFAVSAEVPRAESVVGNTNPSKPVRVQRRPIVPEYTYSEQRKLQGASQVAEEPDADREQSVYYAGCRDARAAGAAPLYRGDPGYRSGMDGDNDGIACEPYRGR
jgi:Excalibur calcium-binding domain